MTRIPTKKELEARLKLVKRIVDGEITQADAAREIGSPRQTISLWVKRYRETGTIGTGEPGRPKTVPPSIAEKNQIRDIVNRFSPRERNIDRDRWDVRAMYALLFDTFGKRYPRGTCFDVLEYVGIDLCSPVVDRSESPVESQPSQKGGARLSDEEYYRMKIEEAQKMMDPSDLPAAVYPEEKHGTRTGKHAKGSTPKKKPRAKKKKQHGKSKNRKRK